MKTLTEVSVVVPVYRSEDCVEELVDRISGALNRSNRTFEIILINDCSPDRSWDKIVHVSQKNKHVIGLNLRKNAGQDNAIMAGLGVAHGSSIIIMDDDLQHDPDDIEKLISRVGGEYDVCYAKFRTKKQALWKNMGSWLNDKIANIVIGKPSDIYLSPYKAMSMGLVQEIIKYSGPYPYVDGLIFRSTSKITQVAVEHHSRFSGSSNYNLIRSIGVWMKVATGFSLVPLRLATYMGFTFSAVGLCCAAWFTIRQLLYDIAPLGWASTIVAVLILGGIQLGCLGLIGEYLGRVFLHLNGRPQYVVKEIIGREKK